MRRLVVLLSVVSVVFFLLSMPCGGADQPEQEQVVGNELAARLPVEYSNNLDEQANAAFTHNGLDPQQVLYTEPLDPPGGPYVMNTVDFNVPGLEVIDVDALATSGDAYFDEVIANGCDLLLSFASDLPNPPGWATYYERPSGAVRTLWQQMDMCNGGGGTDGSVEDLDALELYGPLDMSDTDKFSLVGDPALTSVWATPGAIPVPFISQAVIFTACSALGFVGDTLDVDLDALMSQCDGDSIWEPGETIIFSIQPAGTWDGGEIVVLPFAGAPAFLFHGGHLWNTAFPVAATFGVGTENVDGIEAGDVERLPGGIQKCMGVLIDRSGSMNKVRLNGHTRCADAEDYAVFDIQQFVAKYPYALFSVWTFKRGGRTDETGGWVDDATAIATINGLTGGCSDATPLAEGLCLFSDYIDASWPAAAQADKYLTCLSDGGENNSSHCDGPWSQTGPPPPGNYDAGSWQKQVYDNLVNDQVVLVRYWDTVSKSAGGIDEETGELAPMGVSDESFFADLAESSGGEYSEVLDTDLLPWEIVNDTSFVEWVGLVGPDGRVFICPCGGDGSGIRVNLWDDNGDPMPNTVVHFHFDSLCSLCLCNPDYAYTDSNGVANLILEGGIDATGSTDCCAVTVTVIANGDSIRWAGTGGDMSSMREWMSPDYNADCSVDASDSTIFFSDYMTTACRSDFDDDGMVSLQDFITFALHQGHWCQETSGVPGRGEVTPPTVTELTQNVPNPFTGVTQISFTVGQPGRVLLRVYDVTGRTVRTILEGEMRPERYDVSWDGRDDRGRDVVAGIYFYRLEAAGYSATKKMVFMK